MTKEEFEFSLEFYGFKKQRFTEYNNDAFVNNSYEFGEKQLNLEVFVDYYNVRIVWWYGEGKKVSKCYYVNNELVLYDDARKFIDDFVLSMRTKYGIS